MKQSSLFAFVALTAACAVATPDVSNVAVTQHAATHVVNVTYDLSEDAIVTVAFLTNDVVCEATSHVNGDTWRAVVAGTGKQIAWNMAADLGSENVANYSVKARVSAWTTDAPPSYYVLDLVSGNRDTTLRRYYEYEGQLPEGIGSDLYRTKKMVFRRIPAAGVSFTMGAPEAETRAAGCWQSAPHGAETQHTVTLTKDYYMGVFEVTQAQWIHLLGSIPETGLQSEWNMVQTTHGDTLPIQSCSRNRYLCGEQQAINSWTGKVTDNYHTTFFVALRRLAGDASVTAKHYNLPTEAQWEFACRAGTTTAFSDGRDYDASVDYSDIAVYGRSSAEGPARVGSKKPNLWGLYDMHGNIGEIVLDNVKRNEDSPANEDSNYAADATDPHGWESTNFQVCLRGGFWYAPSSQLRSAVRNNANWWGQPLDAYGFRVAVPVDEL